MAILTPSSMTEPGPILVSPPMNILLPIFTSDWLEQATAQIVDRIRANSAAGPASTVAQRSRRQQRASHLTGVAQLTIEELWKDITASLVLISDLPTSDVFRLYLRLVGLWCREAASTLYPDGCRRLLAPA